MACADCFTSV